MKVGDIVCGATSLLDPHLGTVIDIFDELEAPPTIEVLWDDGEVETYWQDDLRSVIECG